MKQEHLCVCVCPNNAYIGYCEKERSIFQQTNKQKNIRNEY